MRQLVLRSSSAAVALGLAACAAAPVGTTAPSPSPLVANVVAAPPIEHELCAVLDRALAERAGGFADLQRGEAIRDEGRGDTWWASPLVPDGAVHARVTVHDSPAINEWRAEWPATAATMKDLARQVAACPALVDARERQRQILIELGKRFTALAAIDKKHQEHLGPPEAYRDLIRRRILS